MTSAGLNELLERLGSRVWRGDEMEAASPVARLRLGWREVDELLPGGGLPVGVVELSAPYTLSGGTTLALLAVRAAQQRDERAWCAWLDPEATLYAPGAAKAGVDLARLLVVRPKRSELARIAVKVARSQAFDVIVADIHPLLGTCSVKARAAEWPADVLVRKLALHAEEAGATIVLLTNRSEPRTAPWPTALRLELTRNLEALNIYIAKDRNGRVGARRSVLLPKLTLGWE